MPDHHPTGHAASSHRDPLAVVLDAVGGAPRIRTDGSYLVRCPAHDDGIPSLSLACGDDGRALLHCHAGCSTEAVVAALGLRMADLFPQAGGDRPACPPLPTRPAADSDRNHPTPG